MKRLQNKCLIASAVTHVLLLGLVFVGSAFLPHHKPVDNFTFTMVAIPDMLVDEPNMIGGGNPKAGLPNVEPAPQPEVVRPPQPAARQEPTPVQPQPIQQKQPEKQPDPKPEPKPEPPPKQAESTPRFNLDQAVTKTAPKKPENTTKTETSFDFSKAARKTITPSSAPKSANNSAESEAAARQAQQLASAAGQAIARMQKGLSTAVGEIGVPGPGGPAYASYNLAIQKIYQDAWIAPHTGSDNDPIVEVEVTVKGDGAVLSSRVAKRANRRELDSSVQKTLDRVKKLPPFPSGNTEEKRTFRIHFNLSTKSGLG